MLTSGVLFQRRKKTPQSKMQVGGGIQCEQEQAIKIKICLSCNLYTLASFLKHEFCVKVVISFAVQFWFRSFKFD